MAVLRKNGIRRAAARAGSLVLAAMVAAAIAVPSAGAQGGPPNGPPPAGPPGGPPPGGPMRAQMERRLEDRINQVVRKRLALTDDQFAKLRDAASRVEDARRELRNEEMTARFAMRQELLAGDRANETRVAELLDRMPRLERRRLELMEQEQRELAKFLTPSQRARYLGLQDELRRGMQDVQRRRMGMDSADNPPPRQGARRLLKRPPAN